MFIPGNNVLKQTLNKIAPLKEKVVETTEHSPWF